MPFVPFHSGSTNVGKGSKVSPADASLLKALKTPLVAMVKAPKSEAKVAKQIKNASRVAKPSDGPRGSKGYFK